PNADGNWPDEQDDEMRTYTNSLTMNDVVVVPSYGLPYYDSIAEAVYREAMPGYNIEMVDSQNLTPLYGAIHCITKEVPQEEMLRIIHKKVVGIQSYNQDMLVYSQCYNEAEVDSLFLFYRKNGETGYTKTEMYQVCPQNYGVIPNCDPADTISYYIEAKTATASTKHPLSAPDGNHTFWFDPSTDIDRADTEVFNVYPNPAKASFFIQNAENKDWQIELRTLDGRLVMSTHIRGNQLIQRNPAVKNGIYILSRISGSGERKSVKLVLK
ncbi:MAG TPA: agmatine deiminase family protein, partial [Bacteroidales bacterium]|nr:agmatine deiminase family protein [Bacteroidales bacterium]